MNSLQNQKLHEEQEDYTTFPCCSLIVWFTVIDPTYQNQTSTSIHCNSTTAVLSFLRYSKLAVTLWEIKVRILLQYTVLHTWIDDAGNLKIIMAALH
jgi:hypothetical protein